MSRVRRVAYAAFLVALVAITGAVPARAQEPPPPPPPPAPLGIHLALQDPPWVEQGGQFTMLLGIDDRALVERPNAAISITIHGKRTTRTSFDDVIASNDPGGGLYTVPLIPVALLPRLGNNLVVSLGLPGSDATTTIGVSSPGAYPVEVSLTNTGKATSSFITWLVVTPDADQVDEPLMVSSLWSVVAPPSRTSEDAVDPAVADQMSTGGRLDRIATLLGRTAGIPVSLAVGPETVETWSKLAADTARAAPGFTRVRNAARRSTTELLPTPYVPTDLPALEAAGFGDKVPDLIAKGNETMHEVVGAAPADDASSAFYDPADDASTDRVRSMGISRLAVRESELEPVTHPFSPSQAFQLVTTGGRSLAVSTAPFVENLLVGGDPPALKAQRAIAALAEVALESPAIPRGVVLAPPADWNPDLRTYTTLYDALENFPLAQPVTLDNLFERISREQVNGADLERRFAPATPSVTPLSRTQWEAAQQELDAYRAVVPADDPIVARGEQALYRVLSTALTSEQAQAELAHVNDAVRTFTSGITVDAKRVTLTSRRANVPITFENKLGRTVTVRVHLASEKLTFPKGSDLTVSLPPGRTTLQEEFPVEARTSGTFPMDITLTTVDGGLSFGSTTSVTVRSTVFGGFAIALTVGALAFLAAWWANHFRRTRRARRQATPALT